MLAPMCSETHGTQERIATELAAVDRQYRELERRVSTLRSTGGADLSDAVAELRALKPKLRELQVADRRAARLADAGNRSGVPVIGSKASVASARRLNRARSRLEARGGGMVF